MKPTIDFFIALFSIILLSPIIIIISILIKLNSSGPIFFVQSRIGKSGNIISLYKFRTMTNKDRIPNREIFSNDPEVTSIGKYLRRFKIDELPQLFNVLLGNLSIVGPRPGLPTQLKDFNEDGLTRLKVKPGLTGLAQINGNIYLSWKERWKYDREYVENYSFFFDIKIIFKTLLIIFFGEQKFLRKPDA